MRAHNFETLDGIRGSAAIAVAALHAGLMFPPILVPSAYLAVDLFFLLSGVVLEYAYGKRIQDGMNTGQFMTARVIRLYPLYLVGALIGIVSGFVALKMGAGQLDAGGFVAAAAAALLMLPSVLTIAQVNLVFVLNVPGWSLFFELVVNLAFVFLWRWLSMRVLASVILLGLVGLIASTVAEGNADSGSAWSNFAGGFPRVAFSFFLGVLLYRVRPAMRIETEWSWLLVLAPIPVFALTPPIALRPFFDLVCICAVFPALIFAGSMFEPRARTSKAIFGWLGWISFPLYAVHYPVLEFARRIARVAHLDGEQLAIPIAGALLILLCLASAALVRFWDVPARRALTRAARLV